MGKPVRMADIAEKLDISVVSVSKALSGKPGVSEEMRAKVVALANEMGYERNRDYERIMNTGNIGVLVAERFFSENAFYSKLYLALVLKSKEEDSICMIEIVTPEAEADAVLPSLVVGKKVNGVILMGNLSPKYLQAVMKSGIPCLLLDFHIPGIALDCVISDNQDGGFLLTEYLLSLGRKKIGFVGSIWATSSIMDRYLGYQWALRSAGIQPEEEWLLEDRDLSGNYIPIELPEELPDAFLCSCDEVAVHLLEALRQVGKQVPEDVAVCGYDDYRFAGISQLPLTTYQVDVNQMAEVAVKQLSRKVRQKELGALSCIIPGHMIIRDSTEKADQK